MTTRRNTISGRAKSSLDLQQVQVTAILGKPEPVPEPVHPLTKTTYLTQYGMRYGPVRIERMCSDDKGRVAIQLWTGRQLLNITITPTGLIRAGRVEKDWRKPTDLDSAE